MQSFRIFAIKEMGQSKVLNGTQNILMNRDEGILPSELQWIDKEDPEEKAEVLKQIVMVMLFLSLV